MAVTDNSSQNYYCIYIETTHSGVTTLKISAKYMHNDNNASKTAASEASSIHRRKQQKANYIPYISSTDINITTFCQE